MPESPFGDSPKVMDVNRPGKGRVMPTSSRPVIPSPSFGGIGGEVTRPENSLSSHKKIEPISDHGEQDDHEREVVDSPEEAVGNPEKVKTDDKADQTESNEQQEPDKAEVDTAESKESDVDLESESVPEKTEPEAAPKTETKDSDKDEVSDTAGVDALASTAEAKKEAKKQAEEQAKKDAAVQELIDSRQYFVPIGKTSTSSGKTAVIIAGSIVAVTIVLLLIAYFIFG